MKTSYLLVGISALLVSAQSVAVSLAQQAQSEILPPKALKISAEKIKKHAQIEDSFLRLSLAQPKIVPRNWLAQIAISTEWYHPEGTVASPELSSFELKSLRANPLLKFEGAMGWSVFQGFQEIFIGAGYGFSSQSYDLRTTNQVEIPASLLTQVFSLNLGSTWPYLFKDMWGSRWRPGLFAEWGDYQLYQNSGNSFARWSSQTRFISVGPRFEYLLSKTIRLAAGYHWRMNSSVSPDHPRLNSQFDLGVLTSW